MWVKYAAQFGINSIYIYVNGVQYEASNFVVQRGSTTTPTLNTSTAGQGICIGKLCNSYNGYFAAAKIPVFRVYNRVLSAAEIAQNFDALRGRYGI